MQSAITTFSHVRGPESYSVETIHSYTSGKINTKNNRSHMWGRQDIVWNFRFSDALRAEAFDTIRQPDSIQLIKQGFLGMYMVLLI